MKLADKIAKGLHRFVRGAGREIILQNFYHSYYEMDVFRLMPSGLVIEYEIKISRSDYFADFKKSTTTYRGGSAGEYTPVTTMKHDDIKGGKGPNRFFFVTPAGLLKLTELPHYAGLIEFNQENDESWYSIVKNAKLIHKNRFPDEKYKELAELLSFREVHLRNGLQFYKYEAKQQYEKNRNLLKIITDAKIQVG